MQEERYEVDQFLVRNDVQIGFKLKNHVLKNVYKDGPMTLHDFKGFVNQAGL